MSAERKKLLWISISACVFVLMILAVGFFLFTPRKSGAAAPAAIGNSSAPKAQDPQDFLSAPPPPPTLEQPRNQDGGVIIVYGDKPGQTATTEAAGAATATTPTSPAGPDTPATAAPAAAVSAPAAPAKAAPAAAAPKKAAPKSATVKADEYWIQAASFTSRGRADELKTGLAEKGVAALISVKDISGKSWYRVRIGPYSSKDEAEGWLGRLKGIPGCAEAYVSRTTATKPKK